jgi:hypothetical protein
MSLRITGYSNGPVASPAMSAVNVAKRDTATENSAENGAFPPPLRGRVREGG